MMEYSHVTVDKGRYNIYASKSPEPAHPVVYTYRLANARLFTGDAQAELIHQRIFAVLTHYLDGPCEENEVVINLKDLARLIRRRRMSKGELLMHIDNMISEFRISTVHLDERMRNVTGEKYFDEKEPFITGAVYFEDYGIISLGINSRIQSMIYCPEDKVHLFRRGFSKVYLWQQVSYKNIYAMQCKNFFGRMQDELHRVKTEYTFDRLLDVIPAVLPASYNKFGEFFRNVLDKVQSELHHVCKDIRVDFSIFRSFRDTNETKMDDSDMSSDMRKVLLSGRRIARILFKVGIAEELIERREGKKKLMELELKHRTVQCNQFLFNHVEKNQDTMPGEYDFLKKMRDSGYETILESYSFSMQKALDMRKIAIKHSNYKNNDEFACRLTCIVVEANSSLNVFNKYGFITHLVKNFYTVNKGLFNSMNEAVTTSFTHMSKLELPELLKMDFINDICSSFCDALYTPLQRQVMVQVHNHLTELIRYRRSCLSY